MKKLISIIIATVSALCMLTPVSAYKIGDYIGTVYHTDIVAYINNYAIPSYAANGTSVVVAEDLTGAIAIARKYDHRFKIVTLDGQHRHGMRKNNRKVIGIHCVDFLCLCSILVSNCCVSKVYGFTLFVFTEIENLCI